MAEGKNTKAKKTTKKAAAPAEVVAEAPAVETPVVAGDGVKRNKDGSIRKKTLRLDKVEQILMDNTGRTFLVSRKSFGGVMNLTIPTIQILDSPSFMDGEAKVQIPEGMFLSVDGNHRAAYEALKGASELSVAEEKVGDLSVLSVTLTHGKYAPSTISSVEGVTNNGYNLLSQNVLEFGSDGLPTTLNGEKVYVPA